MGNNKRAEHQDTPVIVLRGECPFLWTRCIGDRCELWAVMVVKQNIGLVGAGRNATAAGCVFNHLPPILIQLSEMLLKGGVK